jgi:hypothetical protein
MLAAVGDGQHQHRQVIEDRQQFVPVQTMGQTLAHGFGLGPMALRQRQVFEQTEQGTFDVLGHGAVGRLRRIGQRIQATDSSSSGSGSCASSTGGSDRLPMTVSSGVSR